MSTMNRYKAYTEAAASAKKEKLRQSQQRVERNPSLRVFRKQTNKSLAVGGYLRVPAFLAERNAYGRAEKSV